MSVRIKKKKGMKQDFSNSGYYNSEVLSVHHTPIYTILMYVPYFSTAMDLFKCRLFKPVKLSFLFFDHIFLYNGQENLTTKKLRKRKFNH